MSRHQDLTYVHVPYNWSYADAAAREAAVGLEETDIGKLALQEDDYSLWMLVDDYPAVTWQAIGSATAFHTDEAGEINGLSEKTTPVGADLGLIEDSADSNNKKKVQLANWLKFISGLTEQASPADEDMAVIQEASGGAIKKVQLANLPGGGEGASLGVILIQDQKSQNTAGGTFTQDAWQTRTLTTEVIDSGSNASLSSNQVTLDAGTYMCVINCPAYMKGGHQARLYNISDSAVLLLGNSVYMYTDGPYGTTQSVIFGGFTLAAQKIVEVQHYATITRATSGFGYPANIGTEIYTSALFVKVA